MKGSDKKFFFINFFVESLVLAQFSPYIIHHIKEIRDIIFSLENYETVRVRDVFVLYNRTINWTLKFVEYFGSMEVTSKIHKLEHFVIDTILVIFFLF